MGVTPPAEVVEHRRVMSLQSLPEGWSHTGLSRAGMVYWETPESGVSIIGVGQTEEDKV